MADQHIHLLTTNIEKARKILQHEQRTNHQDKAISSGGLEVFATRWAEEARTLCQQAGVDPGPIQLFLGHLEGYRQQDPLQRAASLRAALATLNDLANINPNGNGRAANMLTATRTVQPRPKPTSQTTKPVADTTQSSAPPVQKATSAPATKQKPVARATTAASRPEPVAPAIEPTVKPEPVATTRPPNPPPPLAPNAIRLEAGMTQGHTALTLLTAEVSAVPKVGPAAKERLNRLGIRTVRDLLFYFPREHRDYSKLLEIAAIPFGELTTSKGLIWESENKRTGGGRVRTIARISDESGQLYVSWFNQPYLLKQLQKAQGEYLVVTGVKQRFGNKVEFNVRSHEFPERGESLNTGRLVPVYALTEGLHARSLREFTRWVVERYAAILPDHLPQSVRTAGQLFSLPEAIAQIHYPENDELRIAARRRLAFDELFMIQLGMQERRSRWQQAARLGSALTVDLGKIFINPPTPIPQIEASGEQNTPSTIGSTLWSITAPEKPFEATLPFTFTDAQHRVLGEIFGDLARSKPMCRLLQGDVGAGKTAVAAAALFMAALNGFQGAIMAPTELLAEQHARSISAMLEPFGIRTVLLTGSQRQRERLMGRAALESGEAAIAIGTHALIQEDVKFYNLGLVIVDEQHRFGVEQRDALRQKGYHPHMLVMTATPIPRTLALTLYGDLDVSVIDQLPPGRQKVISRWRMGVRRKESYKTILEQVLQGRQAFIICPLIEESETLAAKAATTEYERLRREVFPNLRLGLLHGAMKPADKDQTMRSFRDHELDVLIATSVIEVGIDIPNATVMVIEDADRFGLSQLHQFRGRVGRGKHQSYCYVLSADAGMHASERLGVFQETDDGFRLAEEDLRLRGPGDFIGVRQSGMPELRIADLSDTPLIELARRLAEKLWATDPYLRQPEHTALRERLRLFWQNFMPH